MSADSVAMTPTYRRCTTSSATKKGNLKQILFMEKTLRPLRKYKTKAKSSKPAAAG